MTCAEVKKAMALFLYGELAFDEEDLLESHLDGCQRCRSAVDRERELHRSLDVIEESVTPDLLWSSRQQLRAGIAVEKTRKRSWPDRLRDLTSINWHVPSGAQPAGALVLLAIGFFGARFIPQPGWGGFVNAGMDPIVSKVRYVEPESSGKIQIVVEETRQRILTGRLADEPIQRLLIAAAKDPSDPGLRVESMDLLKTRPEDAQVRTALLSALQHDPNPGVRLKALDGLRGWAGNAEVRQTLTRVLLSDKNPGVRTQVIDLLIQQKQQPQMAGVLQELMQREDNGYVRMRCQNALHEMKASVGTF